MLRKGRLFISKRSSQPLWLAVFLCKEKMSWVKYYVRMSSYYDSVYRFRDNEQMKRTLIFYKPEYIDLAMKLQENFLSHHHEVDIIPEEERDDTDYARKMHYDEAIFVEDSKTVIIHDIKTWYTNELPISDVYYKD